MSPADVVPEIKSTTNYIRALPSELIREIFAYLAYNSDSLKFAFTSKQHYAIWTRTQSWIERMHHRIIRNDFFNDMRRFVAKINLGIIKAETRE